MRCVFTIKSLQVEGGGAERVLVDIANGLAARDHEIHIVTFDPPEAQTFYALDRRVGRTGVAIGKSGSSTPRLKLLSGLFRFRRALAAARPDIVVGFMHSTYVPLALASLGAKFRMIASEHVGLAHFKRRRMQRWLVRATGPCFVAKTVPSAILRSELSEREQRSISVLSNPVDLEQFAAGVGKLEQDPPVLLCVGGFREEKDHITLLKAFSRISSEFPRWTLRLVGSGVLRVHLETMVAQLGLDHRVEMPGVMTSMVAEYTRAALVVVPSRYESFGMVVVEALASARPVLGFKDAIGAHGIAIDGHNALLLDEGGDRVASLVRGLRMLMGDDALRRRLGQAGPASVQRFGHSAVVDEWERFLLRCARAS